MRDIKFRGKGVYSGYWVYGSLVKASEGLYIIDHEHYSRTEVDPETVGQYIKIENYEFWEGDIFEFEIGSLYKLNKPLDRGVIELNDYAEWSVGSMLLNRICHRGQVIGNRWDNQELLGGKQ